MLELLFKEYARIRKLNLRPAVTTTRITPLKYHMCLKRL